VQDFAEASAWVDSILAATGTTTSFLCLLFVIQSTAWTKLEHFRPLLALIHRVGPNICRQEFWSEQAINLPVDPQLPRFELCHNTGPYIWAAIQDMLDLGAKAHAKKWSEEYLDWKFTELVEKHMETKGGKAAMVAEKARQKAKRMKKKASAVATAARGTQT